MNKIISLLETHVEKIVMALVGLVCLWLFFSRVIFSPNVVSYENRKFNPGAIDAYISEQAGLLKAKLNQKPESLSPLDMPVNDFQKRMEWAQNIDTSLGLPIPYYSSSEIITGAYRLPRIGEVNDVAVEYIRAVAYVPTQEVTEQTPYEAVAHEPNDLDFVTVEGKFDVGALYQEFHKCFAGEEVEEQMRDPCLAVPIFAAVELQRQELKDDGTWSDWQTVPRPKIDHRRETFEIIEDVRDLPPGGITVRRHQFNDIQTLIDLLQPRAYQIASANEEWFPPSLHRRFKQLQKEEEMVARREAREQARQERAQNLGSRLEERRRRTSDTRTRTRGLGVRYDAYTGTEGLYGRSRYRSSRRTSSGRSDFRTDRGVVDRRGLTRSRRPIERRADTEELSTRRTEMLERPSIDDVYKEFNEILITRRTNLAELREPLVFWAHDDTVEPGRCYRYRIRLGVLNPVAGKHQLKDQDESLENAVILWSNFSDVTEVLEIPRRSYFFADRVLEEDKKVAVTVCKYVLGYWYSDDFAVEKGEVIGKVKPVEVKVEEEPEQNIEIPQSIDYGTGAVLVDIKPVNDWSGTRRLTARSYNDMLYSFNGMDIEHMPIGSRYWHEELQRKFIEIKRAEKEPRQPLRAWDSRLTGGRRRAPVLEYDEEYYDEEYYYDEPLLDEIPGMGRRRY